MTHYPKRDLERELARVARSPLLARGGVGIYRGLIDRYWLAQLLNEAMSGPHRFDKIGYGLDTERVRGGTPARQMFGVDGGPVQDAIFLSGDIASFVCAEVNAPVTQCGERASYTIYAGTGAFLDIHRDVVGCDIALITCLHDSDAAGARGALDFWPEDLTTPLDEIRARPQRRRVRLSLAPGESLLIHGGVMPHCIPPLFGDRLRVVSLMCFAII